MKKYDSPEKYSERLAQRITDRKNEMTTKLIMDSIEAGDPEILDDENYMSNRTEIVEDLWVGQHPFGEDVSEFRYIFCFNPRPQYNIHNWQTVITAPFDDCSDMPPEDFLNELGDMVAACSKKGKTLVHCTAGVNRSAMIAALALIKRGWSPEAAIKQLRDKRGKWLLFNKSFEQWLLEQRIK